MEISDMKQTELISVLESHAAWLRGESGGKCADLRDADLHGADLHGADLRYANLRYANLRGAILRRADLRDADLAGASLRSADLGGADLAGANLRRTNLRYANLCRADLAGADLRGADLRGADLDFSTWPLWCGTSDVQLDKRQQAQLLAHAFQVAPDCKPTPGQVEFINKYFHHPEFFTRGKS
jgi:uncharacterized protein YjbI with pentapeptide repeats